MPPPKLLLKIVIVIIQNPSFFSSNYMFLELFLLRIYSSSCSWSITFLAPSASPFAPSSQLFLFMVVVHVAPSHVNSSCSWFVVLLVPSPSSSCSWSLALLARSGVTLRSSYSLELWFRTPFPPSLALFDILTQL
jgi:hypothetical protein